MHTLHLPVVIFIFFRKPPGPTVFVTTAHCTYLCKDGTRLLDNCCCENVGNITCSDVVNKCGHNPEVVEMTGISIYIFSLVLFKLLWLGNDVEIICGEWETGSNPASVSGEKFNIIIPIERIVRHEGKLTLP